MPKLAFTPTLNPPRPLEGGRNLQDWTPLGRFTGESLDEAIGAMFDPDLPAFFRAAE